MVPTVNPSTPRLRELSLPIEGMTCASCVSRVERVLGRVPGVSSVRVNLATERADLRLEASVDEQSLRSAVEKAGYRVGAKPTAESNDVRETHADRARDLAHK